MTEPQAVTNFRTMLLESATVIAAGIVSARIFYPKAVWSSDDSTSPATAPYAVIWEGKGGRSAFLEPGVLGIMRGTVTANFYLPVATYQIGDAEAFCRNVCTDLYSVLDGMPIRSVDYEMCSEPSPQMQAAGVTVGTAAEIVAAITLDYGLNA